jgi:hypothetical protein
MIFERTGEDGNFITPASGKTRSLPAASNSPPVAPHNYPATPSSPPAGPNSSPVETITVAVIGSTLQNEVKCDAKNQLFRLRIVKSLRRRAIKFWNYKPAP